MKNKLYPLILLLLMTLTTPSVSQVSKDEKKTDIDNHSMWVEPNFVDTQYSALLESQAVTLIPKDHDIHNHIPLGWKPFKVKAKITDVYKGDLVKGEDIELLVYVSMLSKSQPEWIKGQFLLSFCKSEKGVYYTSRDYLIQPSQSANILKFSQIRDHGTDHEGTGDCVGNYPDLNPDTHK